MNISPEVAVASSMNPVMIGQRLEPSSRSEIQPLTRAPSAIPYGQGNRTPGPQGI